MALRAMYMYCTNWDMARKKPINLSEWMAQKGYGDEDVAPLVGISRAQVSRIRRGVNGASGKTARKLEQVTGIPWPTFITAGMA